MAWQLQFRCRDVCQACRHQALESHACVYGSSPLSEAFQQYLQCSSRALVHMHGSNAKVVRSWPSLTRRWVVADRWQSCRRQRRRPPRAGRLAAPRESPCAAQLSESTPSAAPSPASLSCRQRPSFQNQRRMFTLWIAKAANLLDCKCTHPGCKTSKLLADKSIQNLPQRKAPRRQVKLTQRMRVPRYG